jgi:uncharacterized protein YggE
MNPTQAIQRPFGVNVFGSAIVRVEPDIASLQMTVSRLDMKPKKAFQQTREAASQVQTFLQKAKFEEAGFSQITLSQSYKYSGGENRFMGYLGKMEIRVLLRDLNRLEELLSGAVEAGANELNSIQFQTSRLKEIRAEARQRAVAAAREKAEIYCEAAGVALGNVLHIEDVNPNVLRGSGEGHTVTESQPVDDGSSRAFEPGSIVVGAAVMIAFDLKPAR